MNFGTQSKHIVNCYYETHTANVLMLVMYFGVGIKLHDCNFKVDLG